MKMINKTERSALHGYIKSAKIKQNKPLGKAVCLLNASYWYTAMVKSLDLGRSQSQNLNPCSTMYKTGNTEHVTWSLYASVFLSVKWEEE